MIPFGVAGGLQFRVKVVELEEVKMNQELWRGGEGRGGKREVGRERKIVLDQEEGTDDKINMLKFVCKYNILHTYQKIY